MTVMLQMAVSVKQSQTAMVLHRIVCPILVQPLWQCLMCLWMMAMFRLTNHGKRLTMMAMAMSNVPSLTCRPIVQVEGHSVLLVVKIVMIMMTWYIRRLQSTVTVSSTIVKT